MSSKYLIYFIIKCAFLIGENFAIQGINYTNFCACRLKRSKIKIILGDHDQYVTTDGVAVMRAVGAVIRHRNFDMDSYNHDIALLRLRKPVTFSKTIKPVCLPQPGKKLKIYRLSFFVRTKKYLVTIESKKNCRRLDL